MAFEYSVAVGPYNVAVCRSVLQCVAVCCGGIIGISSVAVNRWQLHLSIRLVALGPQCVAVCCSVLQCVAGCCSVLQCVAVCCSSISGITSVAVNKW